MGLHKTDSSPYMGHSEILYTRSVKPIFTRGHISLVVAFKGLNVILGLYKCNYSLIVKRELGTDPGLKQGAGLDKTRWRAGFGPRALCLPPVLYTDHKEFRVIVT